VVLGELRSRGADHLSGRRRLATFGAGIAATVLVAGIFAALDAAQVVVGTTPTVADSSCQDTWTGAARTSDWNTLTNWSTGVPNGSTVHACITGDAAVILADASVSVGELTISTGSSLTVGASGTATTTTTTTTSLHVWSGLENSGTLTADPTGADRSALSIDGPIANTGTITVAGTVTIGGTVQAALTNDGTIGVGPGGLITMGTSSKITNESDGILAFGIDGPPASTADYGRIANGMLSLAGSADPVLEDGFVPPPGSEYLVAQGASSGAFTTVLHDATADYSRKGAVGLTGGAPATATSTSVASSAPAGTPYGEGVQLTATVTPSSGSDPTGFVTFSANGLVLGSAPVTTAAHVTTAAVDVSSLAVGSESITAGYDGDVLFGPSTSPALTQAVNRDATSVTISPSSSSVEPGQPVTYTAAVVSGANGTPTGGVSFSDDGSPISGCQALGLPPSAPWQVTCTENSGPTATHAIAATYDGDAHFMAATGVVAERVAPVSTTASIVVTPVTPTYGQSVTLTSTVASATRTTDPTGTVTFSANGGTLGTSMLSTTAGVTTASMLLTTLPVGSDFVTATYNGGPGFLASSSAPAHVVVGRTPTSLGLLTSGNTSPLALAVTFTATVFPDTGSGETGTVTFFDNGVAIGTCEVSNGQATLSTTTLPVGTNPISASYGGDGDFVGSRTTGTLAQTVDTPQPT
jgi:large repetitive protein